MLHLARGAAQNGWRAAATTIHPKRPGKLCGKRTTETPTISTAIRRCAARRFLQSWFGGRDAEWVTDSHRTGAGRLCGRKRARVCGGRAPQGSLPLRILPPPMNPCTHAHAVPWLVWCGSQMRDGLGFRVCGRMVYGGRRFGEQLMRRTCIWLQVQGQAVSSAEEAVALMAGQNKTLATVVVQVVLQALASLLMHACAHDLHPLLTYIGPLFSRRKAAGSRKSCICSVKHLPALGWTR